LDISIPNDIYMVKFKADFLGCARSNGKILFNYVPKDRKIKK
jgi:NOL1/NOP2/fmu family ribosome biogenesis protein